MGARLTICFAIGKRICPRGRVWKGDSSSISRHMANVQDCRHGRADRLCLTSSFCFYCGVAGGSLSALAGGIWSLVAHKEYATEICVYSFLVGYFMSRVSIAWPQACVSAYHVAFAENPQSSIFDATIPVRLEQLHRYQP